MAKNKKLKGFIFVETMVVIAFLATTLLSVYSSFTTVLDNAKTRLYYDDPVYLYRTYYLLTFLEENNLPEFIETKFANTSGSNNLKLSIVEFGCNAQSVTTADDKVFCENIKSNWSINHIFLMYYDVNGIIQCAALNDGDTYDPTVDSYCRRNTALQNLSVTAVNYLYTLDGYTGINDPSFVYVPEESGYRIVVEFKKEKSRTYSYYNYDGAGNASGSEQSATEQTYEYYYTTLEIPFGETKE